MLKFGKEYYKNTVYLNFENNNDLSNIFERDLDTERIIKELSIISGQSILKNDTLLFFDEIQSCERALTSLKYFNENANEYHICLLYTSPSLVCIIFFVSGVQLFCTGILGQYLAKIYMEVKKRPLYIIRESNMANVEEIR